MTNTEAFDGPPREWLLRAAELEDECTSISVGGLAVDLGLYAADGAGRQSGAFGRFVEFARRAQGLSVERLAEAAGVDLAEVLAVESRDAVPRAEVVLRLAQVVQIPGERLLELAGLASPHQEVSEAAARFAVSARTTAPLSPSEREAFDELLKVLLAPTEG